MIQPDHRMESLFQQAFDLPAPERESWVQAQDAWPLATRLAVLELLRAESTLGQFGRRLSGDVPAGERIGPYEVIGPLGSGGGGSVHLARRTEPPQRLAAVKVVRSADRELLLRLRSEQAALARVDHPAIASILECGELADGRTWFAMAYVPGVPITEHVESVRASTEERVRLVAEACEAVMHAHGRAILHRDLKPSNLLVDTRGERVRPVLIDLGLAKALDGSDLDRGERTEVGRAVGTPEYMAPEQAGGGAPDVRMDVFSLGCVLGAVLTGRPPRRAEELRATGLPLAAAIGRVPIDLPSHSQRAREDRETGGARWREIDWIVAKATDADPAARFASVGEFREALHAWLGHRSPQRSFLRSWQAPVSRRRLLLASAMATMLAAAVWITLSVSHDPESKSSTPGGTLADPADPERRAAGLGDSFGDLPAPPAPAAPRAVPQHSATANLILKLVLGRLDPVAARTESPSQFADRLSGLVREAETRGERLEPSIHLHLAEALFAAGRHKDAIAAAKVAEALDQGHNPLVGAHASIVMANSSSALRDDNLFAFARAERALELAGQVLERDSKEYLEYELSAWATLARRGPIEAEVALTALWDVARMRYGPDDPLTIRFEQARAGVTAMTADENRALAPNREAYRHAREVLGPDHPTTLRAAASLMLILGYTGRIEEALSLFQTVEPHLLATLGPEAPLLINSRMNAASYLLRLGRADEAVDMGRLAHDAYCQKYDRGHVLAVHTEEILMTALVSTGQLDECVVRLRYHLGAPDDSRDAQRKQRMRSNFGSLLGPEAKTTGP